MSSYKQIQAQIARLQREAEDVKKSEIATVVEKLKKSIALYGLTAADVGLDDGARPAARKRAAAKTAARPAGRKTAGAKKTRPGAGVAKFRDPKSGATWSGFGRIPGWLASVKDREAFRIGAQAAPPKTVAPAAAEPQPAAKPVRKASAKAAAKKAFATKKAAPAKQPAAKKGAAARRGAAAKKGAAARKSAAAEPPPAGASQELPLPELLPTAAQDGGQDASAADGRASEAATG